MNIEIKHAVEYELRNKLAVDAEMKDKVIQMQDAAINIEKSRFARHTEKYAMTEDEMMRLEGIEEELAIAKKAKRKAMLTCFAIFGLCIICLIARMVAL